MLRPLIRHVSTYNTWRKKIITGYRNKIDGLWGIPLKRPTSEHHDVSRQDLIIVNKSQSKVDLAKYRHGCALSPIISIFKTDIYKCNFVTWQGIDGINFDKLVGPTMATSKGFLDQERQGLQSTKPQVKIEDAHEDAFPKQSLPKTQ